MASMRWVLAAALTAVLASGAAADVAAKTSDGQVDLKPGPDAVASLRARGQEGLEQALRVYDELSEKQNQLRQQADQLGPNFAGKMESLNRIEKDLAAIAPSIEAWSAAIDKIGGQRGCAVSRLYWYTDLNAAKAAAERTNRPILSLRMLGKLTDEFSCANSRFFRTALYSNKQVSEFLRVNYILHWQSVRPVPRVTIDFGDGRKLERTLTGNSAHYVLAADGTPLDVLPGLYSPLAFRQWLWDLRNLQLAYDKMAVEERAAKLREFHARGRDELLRRWDFDIQWLGDQRTELVRSKIASALTGARLAGQQVPSDPAPKAVKAAAQAVGKTAAESPVLRFAKLGGTWMERGMDDELWQAIADLHRGDVKLDEASVAMMRQEFPRAQIAAKLAGSKGRVEDPILRLVGRFEDSISLDTVRNEYLLHRRVHEQLARSKSGSMDFDALNEFVYATLFLTPSKDPWLGLAPTDVYSALDQDGRHESTVRAAGGG
jgi:hypothetical protein